MLSAQNLMFMQKKLNTKMNVYPDCNYLFLLILEFNAYLRPDKDFRRDVI